MEFPTTLFQALDNAHPEAARQLLTERLDSLSRAERVAELFWWVLLPPPEAHDWLEQNLPSAVAQQWGVVAALSQMPWSRLHQWLERGRPHNLAALDALLAYRKPAANMSPLHQECAPTLPDPPTLEVLTVALERAQERDASPRAENNCATILRLAGEICRHEPRDRPVSAIARKFLQEGQQAAQDEELSTQALQAHYDRFFGADGTVWHDFHPQHPIHVHHYGPTKNRRYELLLSEGISFAPMQVGEHAATPYVEFMLCLPEGWFGDAPGAGALLEDNPQSWPVQMLQNLGRYPHTSGRCLALGDRIRLFEAPEGFPGSSMTSILLLRSEQFPDDFDQVPRGDGSAIEILVLHPLYAEEHRLVAEQGLNALLDRFEAAQVSEIWRLDRPNTCAD